MVIWKLSSYTRGLKLGEMFLCEHIFYNVLPGKYKTQ